ncbi:MAG TPA: glycerophosphodiester phosphodiesterase [Burkholderiales bacterium]
MSLDVQGHRGARGHLPENTLPAFRLAIEMGVSTLELDVGVTRDGVVVVHHDRRLNPDLARGPDGRWVEWPTPPLHSLTYEALLRYDVGRIRPGSEYAARFPHQQPVDGTRIPRLAELFEMAGKTRVRFNIELKLLPTHPDETLPPEPFARAVIAEVRRHGMAARTTLQSFDWRALAAVEREAPEIATAYLTELKDSTVDKPRAAGAKTWSPDYRALAREAVEQAHAAGMRVVAWTVNEPRDIARLIGWGVDGIISDYPDRVLAEMKSR